MPVRERSEAPTAKVETEQEKATREALVQLAKLGGSLNHDDDIVFDGKRYQLPETVDLSGAIKFLTQKRDEDEEEMDFRKTYKYRPLDGARATSNAIKRAFGFSIAKPIYTFFGKQNPELRDIPISATETEQVPWGQLALPSLKGATVYLTTSQEPEYGTIFQLVVRSPRKWRHHIQGFFKLVEEELREHSIYRGQAIDGQQEPQFIALDGVNPEDVVYTQEVMRQLEANVWSPIKHSDALVKLGQPGKRSVLFEGPYGTGKTLGAYLTAQVAVANGWTFIMCRPGRDDLDEVMQTARIYQPSVVFFEDLDTIAVNQGDDAIVRLLDTFDGIQAKGTKMLLVLTTNHVERIHKGMVRPGRLDAVITISDMDRPGVEKLTRRTIGKALANDVDFDAVFNAMQGFMPAFVKEALDRAVRYNVSRNAGEIGEINTDDLVDAAMGLRPQLELMEGASDAVPALTMDRAMTTLVEGIQGRTMIKRTPEQDFSDFVLALPES
jgi:ATPase family protein associated with various cellular activities (AAA)